MRAIGSPAPTRDPFFAPIAAIVPETSKESVLRFEADQPSVADQLPHEVAPLQRIHRDFVVFDTVLHAILCRIGLCVLRFAAAREERCAKQIKRSVVSWQGLFFDEAVEL